ISGGLGTQWPARHSGAWITRCGGRRVTTPVAGRASRSGFLRARPARRACALDGYCEGSDPDRGFSILRPADGQAIRGADVCTAGGRRRKRDCERRGAGDNHNAPVFHWCYKRMGEFIPQLVQEGKQPRVMLDYSGCLLHGLRAMGLNDVFGNLKLITLDPAYRHTVEWLGTAWGHAVAP